MKSIDGFALIEVIVAATIMAFISLAIGTMILNQQQSSIYIEDQLEKIQLVRNFESILDDGTYCQQTLNGTFIPAAGSTNIPSLKDATGTDVYVSNTVEGNLNIGQIQVSNDTVPGPSSSGFIDVTIPITRVRSGGGPKELKPVVYKVKVTVDAAQLVTRCASEMQVLESGTAYDGRTGNIACASINKTCAYVLAFSTMQNDTGCPSGTHCMRVCTTWYNQSLPGVPDSSAGVGTSEHNNIHSCEARIGYYLTYVDPGVVNCGTYFSAVCL